MLDKKQKTKIIIADDHAITADGIEQILEKYQYFEVVAKAASGQELFHILNNNLPDILLIDIYMPGNGIQIAKIIRQHNTRMKIVLMSTEYNLSIKRSINSNKINGFFIKNHGADTLVDMLTRILEGENMFITEKKSSQHTPYPVSENNIFKITPTEIANLRLIAEGFGTKEIAAIKGRSEGTIDKQRGIIMEKLGAKSMSEAIAIAIKNNLI